MTTLNDHAVQAKSSFAELFGHAPEVSACAHGRVNLLGEHTDYNDGYVLPTIIPQMTTVSLARSGSSNFALYAAELGRTADFTLQAPPEPQFARYVYGCLRLLQTRGIDMPGLNIHVQSDVPMGVGLSSSAALEVATLRAVRDLLALDLDDVLIAQLAQRAEIEFAGVNCGIMDQMASSLAREHSMLFLDTRTLERRLVALPAGSEILVIDSGLPRSLAGSKYNERRAECEVAARQFGVTALRDMLDPNATSILAEPYRRRAHHVISENNRVLEAAAGVSAEQFGVLMNASHASLRDDYEVSVPPLDFLVDLLQKQEAVFGARLTGAGFGGACVALCRSGTASSVARHVLLAYTAAGHQGRMLVPHGVSSTINKGNVE